jgi:hypothetical protein
VLRGTAGQSTGADGSALASAELTRYLAENVQDVLPLAFWKANAHRFDLLSVLARKYLCVTASSVPVERLFSTAGFIFSDARAKLAPGNVRYLTFLQKNCDLTE